MIDFMLDALYSPIVWWLVTFPILFPLCGSAARYFVDGLWEDEA